MKAWRLKQPQQIALEEMESELVGEQCVKVKMLYCSITPTDRLIFSGKLSAEYPLILGRQGVGMIVETGAEVKNLVRGDIVCIKPMSPCGTCSKCSEAKLNECENMLTFGVNEDGLMRDFIVVHSSDAVKLPERVSPKDAVFIDYIEMAIKTIDRLRIEKGQTLVVAGATELGIIMAQVAMYYQIVPILVGINQMHLETASQLGVYYTIDSSQVDTKKRIFSLTGGKMADAAVYISDSIYPFSQVTEFIKKNGELAVCGLKHSRLELSGGYTAILNRELTVYGIGESNRISSAINLLANKTINTSALIREEIAFDSVDKELKKEFGLDSLYFRTLVKI